MARRRRGGQAARAAAASATTHFKTLSKEEKAERLYAGVLRYGTYAMVALLPAFALLLKLAYLGRASRYPGRPRRYAEHLVYSAHLHAFAALILIVLLVLPYGPVKAAVAVWIVYYVMRARQTRLPRPLVGGPHSRVRDRRRVFPCSWPSRSSDCSSRP